MIWTSFVQTNFTHQKVLLKTTKDVIGEKFNFQDSFQSEFWAALILVIQGGQVILCGPGLVKATPVQTRHVLLFLICTPHSFCLPLQPSFLKDIFKIPSSEIVSLLQVFVPQTIVTIVLHSQIVCCLLYIQQSVSDNSKIVFTVYNIQYIFTVQRTARLSDIPEQTQLH